MTEFGLLCFPAKKMSFIGAVGSNPSLPVCLSTLIGKRLVLKTSVAVMAVGVRVPGQALNTHRTKKSSRFFYQKWCLHQVWVFLVLLCVKENLSLANDCCAVNTSDLPTIMVRSSGIARVEH